MVIQKYFWKSLNYSTVYSKYFYSFQSQLFYINLYNNKIM